MIRKIIIALMLILSLSVSFAYDFDKINFNERNINQELNQVQNLKNIVDSRYDNITRRNIISEYNINKNDVRTNNNNKLREHLQVKKELVNNNHIVYNVFGGVAGKNLNNANILISDKLIAVENYNRILNKEFEVVKYVGTNNIQYDIYKHPDFITDYKYFFDGQHYKYTSVVSKDGYISFNTSSFSSFVSTIPSFTLQGENSHTFSSIWYFSRPYDTSSIEILNAGGVAVNEVIGIGENSQSTDSYTDMNEGYSVSMNLGSGSTGLKPHLVTFTCFNSDTIVFLEMEVWDSNDPLNTLSTSNIFYRECETFTNPPSLVDPLPSTISVTGFQDEQISFNDYYNNYNVIDKTEVPGPIKNTEEFNSICPDTAACLYKKLKQKAHS